MENARAKGRQIGRPQGSCEDIPAIFLRHYPAYKSKQLNVSELARLKRHQQNHRIQKAFLDSLHYGAQRVMEPEEK